MGNNSPHIGRRRGITAALAMLYLILFSTMVVGFYTAFSLAQQTSYNERDARRALAAAESGMEFMRSALHELSIPYSASTADLFTKVETGLRGQLDGTQNLGGGSIANVNGKLQIPGNATQYIALDSTGTGFRAEVAIDAAQLVVTVTGRAGNSASAAQVLRAVQLRYAMMERDSSIFNFGLASRGPVTLDSNAKIVGSPNAAYGSVLSTSSGAGAAVSVLGNSSVSGDISISNASGTVTVNSTASVAGSTNTTVQADHIHKGVEEPEFPTIDTDIYKKFATNVVSTPGAKFDTVNVKNLYIKANVNPIFAGNIKVDGVVYVETPNKVYFDSNVVVTGAIVGQNNPTGSLSQNIIEIESNVKLRGVEYLPDTPDFPAELRSMTGSTILAPGFRLYFDSNFGAQCGSIVGSEIEFDSNAIGTIAGSVINLGSTGVLFDSNGTLTVTSPGANFSAPGMHFSSRYVALPGSYKEILP